MEELILKHYEEIYHHGIKGQKWGVRRFQKKDGTLTPAGEKRYSSDTGSKQIKKSKHRQKLEQHYLTKGMSKEEAEKAANKRIKVEKVLAATAAITVAAATAYTIHNKYTKEYTDQVLKAGTKFHTITYDADAPADRTFYAAYKNTDRMKYRGMYGMKNLFGIQSYDVTTRATKNMKIPSRQNAAKVFSDLYKTDNEFKTIVDQNYEVMGFMAPGKKQQSVLKTALGRMSDKQLLKEGYDAFNIGLVNHEGNNDVASKKFYNKLKELGYNAILDVNDHKYSGYKSNSPVIVFDTESVVREQVSKMSKGKTLVDYLGSDLLVNGTMYAAEIGVISAGVKASKATKNKSSTDKTKR